MTRQPVIHALTTRAVERSDRLTAAGKAAYQISHRRTRMRVDGRIFFGHFNGARSLQLQFHAHHRERVPSFADPRREVILEALSVEAVGGGAKFREPEQEITTACLPALARQSPFLHGAWREAAALLRGSNAHQLRGNLGPAGYHRATPDRRDRGRLAGGDHREESSCAGARRAARACTRRRHAGRSGDARSVQQLVHVDRRADGRRAAKHRRVGQHQGAARLLVRGLRWRRLARRQRPAHAGASRLDGSRGRDHHPRARSKAGATSAPATPMRSTRLTTAAPTSPTSQSAPRYSTIRGGKLSSGLRAAGTMPTSVEFHRGPCRRPRRQSTKKASISITSSWCWISTTSASARFTRS